MSERINKEKGLVQTEHVKGVSNVRTDPPPHTSGGTLMHAHTEVHFLPQHLSQGLGPDECSARREGRREPSTHAI